MPSTVKRQSAAVMFTDIAGYTSIMASDEEKALSLLQDKRKILKPLIKQLLTYFIMLLLKFE